jgi:F0F1-type ATP synthase gamma subunit
VRVVGELEFNGMNFDERIVDKKAMEYFIKRIEQIKQKRKSLEEKIGKEEFKKLIDAIAEVINQHNLDRKPELLEEIFWYIVEDVTLSK